MKSLSSALSAALGAPVQRPAILVEVAFDPVCRWSSYANLTWGGKTWVKEDINIDSLQIGALSIQGTLRIGNGDGAIGALVRAQGVQDRAVRIWGYDAGATSSADVVWLADAIAAKGSIDLDFVSIGLQHACELTLSPRTFVNSSAFGPLLPAGSVLNINGQAYTLARRG